MNNSKAGKQGGTNVDVTIKSGKEVTIKNTNGVDWYQVGVDILIPSIVAILGIISIFIAGSVTSNINYAFYNDTIKFDKQAAAQQLLIEINAMKPNLLEYSDLYTHNYDLYTERGYLFGDDPNVEYIIEVRSKNKTELQPYEIDIINSRCEGAGIMGVTPVSEGSGRHRLVPSPNILLPSYEVVNCTIGTTMIPPPLYNENGLYYLYIKDFSKFNNKSLSVALYRFYKDIIDAESNRRQVQNFLDTNHNTNFENQSLYAYMDMRMEIMRAAANIDNITRDLEKEVN